MQDRFPVALDGVGDCSLAAIPAQHANIAGLAARARIEHRAVQHDALGPARQYRAGRGTQPRFVEEQLLGHAVVHSFRRASRRAASHSSPIAATEFARRPANAASIA